MARRSTIHLASRALGRHGELSSSVPRIHRHHASSAKLRPPKPADATISRPKQSPIRPKQAHVASPTQEDRRKDPNRWRRRAIFFGGIGTFLGVYFYFNQWIFADKALMEEIPAPKDAQPRDEQGIVRETYAHHMDELRSKELRGKVLTSSGEVIRFHGVQHASNSPCEDEMAYEKADGIGQNGWPFWAIFDGHAGGATSKLLKEILIAEVAKAIAGTGENNIEHGIRSTFVKIDDQIIQRGLDALHSGDPSSPDTKQRLAPAFSGSCALLAALDPESSRLRVAVTGDSRAVLGRFDDGAGKYTAVPMSVDQNGRDLSEKARLDRLHPDEDHMINPKSGRLFGLAITRAFGDSRWKWSEEDSLLAHEAAGGPRMKGLGPPGSIKTPPYVVAEPEIRDERLRMGTDEENADFLIMASDGFWDHISSEDAVVCVTEWVRQHADSAKCQKRPVSGITNGSDRRLWAPFGRKSPIEWPLKGRDLWGDWQVEPEDFVVEEQNAATHLVQNAFGGRRRTLFCGAMAEKYPLSRWARDDISVYVIFFGRVGGKRIIDEPELRIL